MYSRLFGTNYLHFVDTLLEKYSNNFVVILMAYFDKWRVFCSVRGAHIRV
jgi:hypothetical protein